MILPEHMDRWTRNARLYETLKGMGVFVTPIPDAQDNTKIDRMIVSADLPQCLTENGPERDVVGAVERTEIVDVIASTQTPGMNVIDFPSVR